MKKPTVLFLCSQNVARSQMAEGLLKHLAAARFQVESAGLDPGAQVHPLAIEAMQEVGIDIASQRPKSIRNFLGRVAVQHSIFVCERAESQCPTIWPFTLGSLYWPVKDPALCDGSLADQLEEFRRARDVLDDHIRRWLADGDTTAGQSSQQSTNGEGGVL